MNWILAAFCACLFLAHDDGGKPADKQKELDRLKGTWKVVSMVHNGKEVPNAKDHGISFDGEAVTIQEANGSSEGKCTLLDPTKSPKQIDLSPASGGKKLQGIYELEGDQLKLCLAMSDTDRPSRFESKEGSKHRLVVLKRDK